MLHQNNNLLYRLTDIFANHWDEFFKQNKKWIRPVIIETINKILACRTPILGCHIYQCHECGKIKVIPHSCKSRFCPACGKYATDKWANSILNELLDVPYHHIVLTLPYQFRLIIGWNRRICFNILLKAASLALQQWAEDTKNMRMGIIAVLHTFGGDIKWNPHIHLIVTGGGLSLDGEKWIETDTKFFREVNGLKKQWRYWVIKLFKKAHKKKELRFGKSISELKEYPVFGKLMNKLYAISWWVYIGASLRDPRFSLKYIGRYTKRAVMAEYRISNYNGKTITFSYKDYADNGKKSEKTLTVMKFIERLIRHIPDKSFPVIRHYGLFANRNKGKYIPQSIKAIEIQKAKKHEKKQEEQLQFEYQEEEEEELQLELKEQPTQLSWAERQEKYTGKNPLFCYECNRPMVLIGEIYGRWEHIENLFVKANLPLSKGYLKLKPQQPP